MSDGEQRPPASPGEEVSAGEADGSKTSRRRFIRVVAVGSVGAGAGLVGPVVGVGGDAEAAATEPDAKRAAVRRDHYGVFSEGWIGGMRVKNRFCRSAAFEHGGSQGRVNERIVGFHRGFAEGGVGLALTGYMAVMEWGMIPTQVAAYDDRFIPGLAELARTVHDVGDGCRIGAQIGHDGRGQPGTSPLGAAWATARIGPSGLDWEGGTGHHAMTVAEIERFCQDMGRAAYRLQQAGFDCVQIHGAHHYLINTFTSPYTNRRTDEYGGSLENRVRIVRRVVEEIRDRTGPDFPILIKVNCDDGFDGRDRAGIDPDFRRPEEDRIPGEVDLETFPEFARAIAATGVDAIDISGADLFRTKAAPPLPLRLRHQSFYRAHALAADVDVPVILGCGNRHIELLEYLFQQAEGRISFFNMARPLIREPDLIRRWQEGRGGPRSLCVDWDRCFPSHECAVLAAYREPFASPEASD